MTDETLDHSQRHPIAADDVAIFERIVKPAAPYEKFGLTVNEGVRFITLGESGCGKTTLMRCVVYYLIMKRWARFALVHDTKTIFPEYPQSLQMVNTAQFLQRGGFRPGDPAVVSFRGSPRHGIVCTPEEVAALSLQYARRGVMVGNQWTMNPHVTVIDEVAAAATAGRKRIAAPSVLLLAEQGRLMGASLVCTTQEPINMPSDLRAQATAIAFGRLTLATLNYLDHINLPPAMISAIRGPNNEGLPNHQFVLFVKGEPWDGRIHKLSKATVNLFS